jgi:hypothetical protein
MIFICHYFILFPNELLDEVVTICVFNIGTLNPKI